MSRSVHSGVPVGLEVACGHVAELLASRTMTGELECASRELARAARRVGLPERTLVTWLTIAGAVAFGGSGSAAGVIRQLTAWVGEEFRACAA
jgi:hypothetical protein